MGKNIRRGKKNNVRCADCGQLTRRDRSVYLFRNGLKTYYCPDCAKKVRGSRLYKGMPTFVRKPSVPKVRRKFVIYSKDQNSPEERVETPQAPEVPEPEQPNEEQKEGDENTQ